MTFFLSSFWSWRRFPWQSTLTRVTWAVDMNVRRAVLFVKIVTAFILKGNEIGDEEECQVLSGKCFCQEVKEDHCHEALWQVERIPLKAIKNIGSDRPLTLEVINRHWLMITGCKLAGHHNCGSDTLRYALVFFFFFFLKREFDGKRERKKKCHGERWLNETLGRCNYGKLMGM